MDSDVENRSLYAKAMVQSGSWFTSYYLVRLKGEGPLKVNEVSTLIWKNACRLRYDEVSRMMVNVLHVPSPVPKQRVVGGGEDVWVERDVDMTKEVQFSHAALARLGILLAHSTDDEIGNVGYLSHTASLLMDYHCSLVKRLQIACKDGTKLQDQLSIEAVHDVEPTPPPVMRPNMVYTDLIGKCERLGATIEDADWYIRFLRRRPKILTRGHPNAPVQYVYQWIDEEDLLEPPDKNEVNDTALRPIEYTFHALNNFGSRLVEAPPGLAISYLDIPSVDDKVVKLSIIRLKEILRKGQRKKAKLSTHAS